MDPNKDSRYERPYFFDLQSSQLQNISTAPTYHQFNLSLQPQALSNVNPPPNTLAPDPRPGHSQSVLSTLLQFDQLPALRSHEQLPQINVYGLPKRLPVPTNPEIVRTSPSPGITVNNTNEKGRMRVNRACDRCRSHKIKCTGLLPCSNCSKQGIECKYRTKLGDEPEAKRPKVESNDTIAPVPAELDYHSQALPILEKPAVEKSESDYTTYLENRIHYLENLLLENLAATFKNVGNVNVDVQDVNDMLKSQLSKWRFCRRHQNALVIELCNSLYKSLTPESKAKVPLPRTQYFGWNMSGCNYLKPETLPPLPPLDDLPNGFRCHLVNFFFSEINPLYAILHEAVFREQIDAFKKLKDTNPANQSNQAALFLAMLCLVYALGIRFTEFMKADGPSMEMLHFEEKLFKYSHKVVLVFSFEWESFELIQCWLLVTLYLRISHRQTSANFAMGHAVTMCRSMGLGRTTQVIAEVTPYEILKAKRIFYAVYSFDRVIGLQAGRYRALNEFDITRKFPSLDFELQSKRDDWITLPAFAMMHIARIANFIHTSTSDNYDLIKAQQINKEIHLLGRWLNRNGFDDAKDIYPYGGSTGPISSMVKAQVKLHYYDLLIAVHGKLLFNYLGKRIASEGMKIESVLEANEGVIYILKKCHEANTLYAPWYLNLLLLFNVGINCLVFINAGIFLAESRRLMSDSMSLLQHLQNSSVKDEKGKLIFRERFKMVSECIWVFKTANHIMTLSFEESIRTIKELGIDHGSADVNKQYFTQFGIENVNDKGKLDELMEHQNNRSLTKEIEGRRRIDVEQEDEHTPGRSTAQPDSTSFGVDQLLGNLQWFDQWLDFNYQL